MNNFEQRGYQILPQVIDLNAIASLQKRIELYTQNKTAYGIRDLHLKIKAVADLAASDLIQDILHEHTKNRHFKLIKAIFFNKNLQHNWAVPWHQDKTIAVKEKAITPGYKNWTIKQGVPHVQPPLPILENITTVRIALDDTDSDNGALKIMPRSHNSGILKQEEINSITKHKTSVYCSLKVGDILIMHPLLLHSSNKSINNKERRTIHLEYSSCDLPFNLAWHC